MTEQIALAFIDGLFQMYIGYVPLMLITLLIFKLLRYASGWQPSKHQHKIFEVS